MDENVSSPWVAWKQCKSKVRYRNAHDATDMARKIHQRRVVVLRSYECPICAGYHLTKQELT